MAKDQQAAGHDVGTLHRDRNRRALPRTPGKIARPQNNALAADDIHDVLGDIAAGIGAVILGNRRRHRRHIATVHRRRRSLRQRADRIGLAANPRQCFFHTFKTAHRQTKLLADPRIRAGHHRTGLGTAGRSRGQGDRAPHRQAFVEHVPALAGHVHAANQLAQGDEHLAAVDRAILER